MIVSIIVVSSGLHTGGRAGVGEAVVFFLAVGLAVGMAGRKGIEAVAGGLAWKISGEVACAGVLKIKALALKVVVVSSGLSAGAKI